MPEHRGGRGRGGSSSFRGSMTMRPGRDSPILAPAAPTSTAGDQEVQMHAPNPLRGNVPSFEPYSSPGNLEHGINAPPRTRSTPPSTDQSGLNRREQQRFTPHKTGVPHHSSHNNTQQAPTQFSNNRLPSAGFNASGFSTSQGNYPLNPNPYAGLQAGSVQSNQPPQQRVFPPNQPIYFPRASNWNFGQGPAMMFVDPRTAGYNPNRSDPHGLANPSKSRPVKTFNKRIAIIDPKTKLPISLDTEPPAVQASEVDVVTKSISELHAVSIPENTGDIIGAEKMLSDPKTIVAAPASNQVPSAFNPTAPAFNPAASEFKPATEFKSATKVNAAAEFKPIAELKPVTELKRATELQPAVADKPAASITDQTPTIVIPSDSSETKATQVFEQDQLAMEPESDHSAELCEFDDEANEDDILESDSEFSNQQSADIENEIQGVLVPRRYEIEELLALQGNNRDIPLDLSADLSCLKVESNVSNSNGQSRQPPNNHRGSTKNNTNLSPTGQIFGRRGPSDKFQGPERRNSEKHHDRSGSSSKTIDWSVRIRSQSSSSRKGSGGRSMQSRYDPVLPPVEPLQQSKDRWQPDKDADGMALFKKRIKGILNKLTLEKFDVLCSQFLNLVTEMVKTIDFLQELVVLIFDKALAEPTFVSMYSSLCLKISNGMAELESPEDDGQAKSFRRILLDQCQREFENGIVPIEGAADQSETDREFLVHLQKQRFLGNILFIGELFKDAMLTEKIMHRCIHELLKESIPAEEDIEALCKLMMTIGKRLDREKAKQFMDRYFHKMGQLAETNLLSSRTRFMILDLIDLRSNRWKPRRKKIEAKTLEEFHKDIEKEQQAKAAAASRSGSARFGSGRFDTFSSRGSSPRVAKAANVRQTSSILPGSFRSMTPSASTDKRGESFIFERKNHVAPAILQRTSTAPVAPPTSNVSQKGAQMKQITDLVKEFFRNSGGSSGIQEIKTALDALSMDANARNIMLVSKTIGISMDQSSRERESAVHLLSTLVHENFLTKDDLISGFREITEYLSDYLIDVPFAPMFAGTIFGHFVCNGCLSIKDAAELVFPDQVEHGVFGDFLKHALKLLIVVKEIDPTRQMLADSHFDMRPFIKPAMRDSFSDYLKTNDLTAIFSTNLSDNVPHDGPPLQ